MSRLKERLMKAEKRRFEKAWSDFLECLNRDNPRAFEWLMESNEREAMFKQVLWSGHLLAVIDDKLVVME